MTRQDNGVFQKIGLLSDLTNAMTSEDLRGAFQALGQNGDHLYEIFAEAVYKEIEKLMNGGQEEATTVYADALNSAQQIYGTLSSLYQMMVSLSNTPAMQPLNFMAEKMTGVSFNPGYHQPQPAYQPPQYSQPPQQPQYEQPHPYPAHTHRRGQVPAPEPLEESYEQPAPMPQPAPAPRRQAAPRPQPAQQPQAPAQPPKKRQYGAAPAQQPAQPQQAQGQQPAPQRPGPAQTNRPAPIQGHTDPAPTLPPRRNRITGLF